MRHRRVLFRRRLGLALLASVLVGCRGEPAPRGNSPAGSSAPGNSPAGSSPAGSSPAGSSAAGKPLSAEGAPLRMRAEGQLGPGKNTLFIDIAPPDGAKLTLESPLSVRGSGGIGLDFPRRLSGPLSSHSMPLRLPIDVADGATGPARLELTYYWCTEGNEAACTREQAHLDVELDLSGSAAGGEALLTYRARGRS